MEMIQLDNGTWKEHRPDHREKQQQQVHEQHIREQHEAREQQLQEQQQGRDQHRKGPEQEQSRDQHRRIPELQLIEQQQGRDQYRKAPEQHHQEQQLGRDQHKQQQRRDQYKKDPEQHHQEQQLGRDQHKQQLGRDQHKQQQGREQKRKVPQAENEWVARVRALLVQLPSEVPDGVEVEKLGVCLEAVLGQVEAGQGSEWWYVACEMDKVGAVRHHAFRRCLENARNCPNVKTNRGKGRVLLRLILHNRILVPVIEAIPRIDVYHHKTILGTEGGCLLMTALARMIDRLTWKLDLDNNTWLDVTWNLANKVTHELVPTADLGIYVALMEQRPVVTQMVPGSVAAEDDKIEVGDVITSIDGESVAFINGTERIFKLLSRCKGKPIRITVTKGHDGNRGELYAPVVPLLKKLGVNIEDLQRRYHYLKRQSSKRSNDDDFNPLEDEDVEEWEQKNSGYSCLYLGSVNVGASGEVQKIELGVSCVLNRSAAGEGHPATLLLQELDLKLMRTETKQLVFKFAYPNVTSCGRLVSHPNYFAFISAPSHAGEDGDVTMLHHSGHMCHVFYTPYQQVAKEILENIADGFQRTNFTV